MGVPQIEAGFPNASEKQRKCVEALVDINLDAQLSSFARAKKEDIDAVADTGADGIVVSLSISPYHRKFKFNDMSKEIISLGNPLINIHRSHRYFAIQRLKELLGSNISLYGGYLGVELLMGIYYDNLIFTKLVTNSWDQGLNYTLISQVLAQNFIRENSIDFDVLIASIEKLRTFNPSLSKKERQFHGLFEIGVLHHSQDIHIALNLFSR